LVQEVKEILKYKLWVGDLKDNSRRLTWLNMLAAVTRGSNKDAMGIVTIKMVVDLYPGKFNLLLELVREAKVEGNLAADATLCEELVDRYP
jgi:hypothetical protein